MQVRELTAGDVRGLIGIARGEIDEFITLVEQSKSAGEKEQRASEIGRAVFDKLLDKHFDRMWAWLADVAGMTVEEFDKAPASAPLEVINQLLDRGLSDFFAQARLLWARVVKEKALTASGTK